MAKLQWNQNPNPSFEMGVDRGVVYPKNGLASPWNGLVNVTEIFPSGNKESYYFDGSKYAETLGSRTVSFEVTSIGAPDILDSPMGKIDVIPGFFLTKQPKEIFGFSYRTQIGLNLGFKIHLIYNAVITTSNFVFETKNQKTSARLNRWTIKTAPTNISGFLPISHFIFDTSKMPIELLKEIETIIYGTEETSARLPTMTELETFYNWATKKIIFQDAGTSPLVSGFGDLTLTDTNGVYRITSTTKLRATTYSGIFRLES